MDVKAGAPNDLQSPSRKCLQTFSTISIQTHCNNDGFGGLKRLALPGALEPLTRCRSWHRCFRHLDRITIVVFTAIRGRVQPPRTILSKQGGDDTWPTNLHDVPAPNHVQNDLPRCRQERLRSERGGKDACSSTSPCDIVSLLNLLAKRLPRVLKTRPPALVALLLHET